MLGEGGFTATNSLTKPCLRLSPHTAPNEVLVSIYIENLTFYRRYGTLLSIPLVLLNAVYQIISLLNFYDSSSRMFTCVILGQLARELLRYLTYTRFPVISSFRVLIISLALWILPNLFGTVICTIDFEIDLPLRSHFQS